MVTGGLCQFSSTFVFVCVLLLCVCGPSHRLISLAFAEGYHLVFHYQQESFHCGQLEQCRPSLFSPPPLQPLWQLYIDTNHKHIFWLRHPIIFFIVSPQNVPIVLRALSCDLTCLNSSACDSLFQSALHFFEELFKRQHLDLFFRWFSGLHW